MLSPWHSTYLTLTKVENLLDQYLSISSDSDINQRYHQELLVTFYLDSIDSSLANQVKGSVLNGVTPPTLVESFNAVQRITPISTPTSAPVSSPTVTPEALALAVITSRVGRGASSDCGRKRDQSCGGATPPSHNSFPPYEHCGRNNHITTKCFQKFGYLADWPHKLPLGSVYPMWHYLLLLIPCCHLDNLLDLLLLRHWRPEL